MPSQYKPKKSKLKGHYWFKSDCGETYRCLFSKNRTKNEIHGMHTLNPVYNIIISRKYHIARPGFDKKVSATISKIVNNFFIKNPDAVICYICDNLDKKAEYRNRIFYKWFKSCNLEPRKHMISTNIEGVVYFGAIMLYSNTDRKKFYDYLRNELAEIEDKEITINQ